jgi:hypothetical protein
MRRLKSEGLGFRFKLTLSIKIVSWRLHSDAGNCVPAMQNEMNQDRNSVCQQGSHFPIKTRPL